MDDPETNDPPTPINAIQEQTKINMTNTGTDATEEAAQGFEYLSNYKILESSGEIAHKTVSTQVSLLLALLHMK